MSVNRRLRSPTPQAIRGCLLGGALGDALGAPVEFMPLAHIRRQYGPGGPDALGTAYGVDGAITDDTQMTLFTAEGLLEARRTRQDPLQCVHAAYLRWLLTQERARPPEGTRGLAANPLLYARRAPGATCLSALQSGEAGSVSEPLNNSKGCGGVMRVAPVGLLYKPEEAFGLGLGAAALTHGHTEGYLPGGAFAMMISLVARGRSIREAAEAAHERVSQEPDSDGTVCALEASLELVTDGLPSAEDIEGLGGGWTGEEALAIATACAIAHSADARAALRASVTHTGDSDSTGTLCGQLVGASLGEQALPKQWLETLELRDVVTTCADELCQKACDEHQP